MSSLAELPELVGFFSYSREDDEDSRGSLSAFRDAVGRELATQLGRTGRNFRLWQDKTAIALGEDWESAITKAVDQSVFFIAIITPRAINSKHYQFEFNSFLAREHALGREDLVFPILYIPVPGLVDEAVWRADPLLSIVAKRQYVDWRPLRHIAVGTTVYGEAIGGSPAGSSRRCAKSGFRPRNSSGWRRKPRGEPTTKENVLVKRLKQRNGLKKRSALVEKPKLRSEPTRRRKCSEDERRQRGNVAWEKQ